MSGPIYIFAGGGTGGHLYPGIAVAEELKRLRPEAQIVFACSDRDIDRRILDPLEYAIVPQPVRPLPRGVRGWFKFFTAYFSSMRQAGAMMADLRPAGVLGLGGFAAAPVIRAARRTGVRCGLLNPDAVPGMANRHLARSVNAIFTQFESTRECFARRGYKVRHVGCPVRPDLLNGDRGEAMKHFNLSPPRKTILILGGSLGAGAINAAFASVADELEQNADNWQVIHITGPDAAGLPDGWPKGSAIGIRAIRYCDRMDLAYAAADIAVARAGASTVAELAATATPAVLMPYPNHRDRHQQLNAEALAATGAAEICPDTGRTESDAQNLKTILLKMMHSVCSGEKSRISTDGAGNANAARVIAMWLDGSFSIRNQADK